jgi:predicted DNA-binding protein with PD1-like motif
MRTKELTNGGRLVLMVVVDKGEEVVSVFRQALCEADLRAVQVGGHLLGGEAWPTLEPVATEVGPELAKRHDPQTALALLAS